mmetsp:Transcript_42879/g.110608  ORF Transcript_42879/g.110608 Transcript_42879/m.110608 type:complete len:302 (-) Transcript_42879:697-1602(-)
MSSSFCCSLFASPSKNFALLLSFSSSSTIAAFALLYSFAFPSNTCMACRVPSKSASTLPFSSTHAFHASVISRRLSFDAASFLFKLRTSSSLRASSASTSPFSFSSVRTSCRNSSLALLSRWRWARVDFNSAAFSSRSLCSFFMSSFSPSRLERRVATVRFAWVFTNFCLSSSLSCCSATPDRWWTDPSSSLIFSLSRRMPVDTDEMISVYFFSVRDIFFSLPFLLFPPFFGTLVIPISPFSPSPAPPLLCSLPSTSLSTKEAEKEALFEMGEGRTTTRSCRFTLVTLCECCFALLFCLAF